MTVQREWWWKKKSCSAAGKWYFMELIFSEHEGVKLLNNVKNECKTNLCMCRKSALGVIFFLNFWSTTFTRLLSNCIGSDCMNEVNESLVFLLYAIKRFCYTPVSKTHCITWQPLLFHQALVQPGLNLFNATINMQEMVPCCCEICSIPTAIVPCCSIRP